MSGVSEVVVVAVLVLVLVWYVVGACGVDCGICYVRGARFCVVCGAGAGGLCVYDDRVLVSEGNDDLWLSLFLVLTSSFGVGKCVWVSASVSSVVPVVLVFEMRNSGGAVRRLCWCLL